MDCHFPASASSSDKESDMKPSARTFCEPQELTSLTSQLSKLGPLSNPKGHLKHTGPVLSLQELCCRSIGRNVPFELVQVHPQPIPDFLQERICFWSFPSSKDVFAVYGRMLGVTEETIRKSQSCKVSDLTQTGMHVAGTVMLDSTSLDVYVLTDRGRITTTGCSCGGSSWCVHVVALCLARIEGCVPLKISPPISERLRHFDREQLQKLVQYMMDHIPVQGVRVAEHVISILEEKQSEMSTLPGAPDITAGGSVGDIHQWLVNTSTLHSHLKNIYNTFFPMSQPHIKTFDLDGFYRSLVHFQNLKDPKQGVSTLIGSLLTGHDDTIVAVLEWVLGKIESMSRDLSTADLEFRGQWSLWCLSRMTSSILNIFMVDPLIRPNSKFHVLDVMLRSVRDLPETEYLCSVLHVCSSTHDRTAIEDHLADLLQALQLAATTELSDTSLTDSKQSFEVKYARHLFNVKAVLEYMMHHKLLHSRSVGKQLVKLRDFIFPGIADVDSSLSMQDFCRINPILKYLDERLLLDFIHLLTKCLCDSGSSAECVMLTIFGAFGKCCTLPSDSHFPATELFCSWFERRLHSTDTLQYEEDSSPAVKRAAQLAIDYIHQVDLSSVKIRLFALLNLLGLVLCCGEHLEECLELLQTKIFGAMYDQLEPQRSSFGDAVVGNILRDAFQCLLQNAFMHLPDKEANTLFSTLDSSYPWPLHAGECMEMLQTQNRKARKFSRSDKADISGSSPPGLIFPHISPSAKLPSCNKMGLKSGQYNSSQPDTSQSVNVTHVSFLQNLMKMPLKGKLLLLFKLHLLAMRVHNCRVDIWMSDLSSHSSSEQVKSCLELCSQMSPDEQFQALELLGKSDSFMYYLPPVGTLSLILCLSQHCTPSRGNGPSVVGTIALSLLKFHSRMSPLDIVKCVNLIAQYDCPSLVEAVEYVVKVLCQLPFASVVDREVFEMKLAFALGVGYSQCKELESMEHHKPSVYLRTLQDKAISLLGLGRSETLINAKFHSLASPRYKELLLFREGEYDCRVLVELICDCHDKVIDNFVKLMRYIFSRQLNVHQFQLLLRAMSGRMPGISQQFSVDMQY